MTDEKDVDKYDSSNPLLEESSEISGFDDTNEGKDGSLTAESEGDCIRVRWNVNNPSPKDWIGLFVHERSHDTNFSMYCNTEGSQTGEYVFRGLVRGYYDLRFFEGGSSVRSSGFNVCVVCVGTPVRVTVTRPNRKTLAVSWPPEFTNSGDWVGLFKADQCGNRARNTIAHKLVKDAETAIAPKPRLLLPCPRTPGDYHVRFFLKDSLSLTTTNAYSGIAVVHIPNEDDLIATFDRKAMSLSVTWKAYSVEPNEWQWIGLYDSSDPSATRLTYEYVCKHKYTSPDHDEGIVTFTEVPSSLKACAASGKISPDVSHYELRFFNAYKGAPLFCRPCKLSF